VEKTECKLEKAQCGKKKARREKADREGFLSTEWQFEMAKKGPLSTTPINQKRVVRW